MIAEQKFYHATPIENAELIESCGYVKPGHDGSTYFTTNMDRAAWFMKGRGIRRFTVFAIDDNEFDVSLLVKSYDGAASGDDCYRYDGTVPVSVEDEFIFAHGGKYMEYREWYFEQWATSGVEPSE